MAHAFVVYVSLADCKLLHHTLVTRTSSLFRNVHESKAARSKASLSLSKLETLLRSSSVKEVHEDKLLMLVRGHCANPKNWSD